MLSKLIASTLVSILQVYAFLLIAWLYGIETPAWGYLAVIPALALTGLMLGSLGMLLSSVIKQLENFAGVMNFVIFPMFFASGALYPLWQVQQSSPLLYEVCLANPFTYGIELIRFALYLQINWQALAVVVGMIIIFTGGAILAYDPARGLMVRRGGGTKPPPPARTVTAKSVQTSELQLSRQITVDFHADANFTKLRTRPCHGNDFLCVTQYWRHPRGSAMTSISPAQALSTTNPAYHNRVTRAGGCVSPVLARHVA